MFLKIRSINKNEMTIVNASNLNYVGDITDCDPSLLIMIALKKPNTIIEILPI